MKTILVVDDHDDLRQLTARILREHGYNVLEASTGEEGVNVIRNADVDLIFTDVFMPGAVNSVEMVTRAKIQLCKHNLKVLYTSGYVESAKSVIGDAETIAKPYRAEELIKKIEEMEI